MRHISVVLSSSVMLNIMWLRVWDEPSADLRWVLSLAPPLFSFLLYLLSKARHTEPVTAKFGANRIRFLLPSTHNPALVTRPLSLSHTCCFLMLQTWNSLASHQSLESSLRKSCSSSYICFQGRSSRWPSLDLIGFFYTYTGTAPWRVEVLTCHVSGSGSDRWIEAVPGQGKEWDWPSHPGADPRRWVSCGFRIFTITLTVKYHLQVEWGLHLQPLTKTNS